MFCAVGQSDVWQVELFQTSNFNSNFSEFLRDPTALFPLFFVAFHARLVLVLAMLICEELAVRSQHAI